jgi:hypothetical protein
MLVAIPSVGSLRLKRLEALTSAPRKGSDLDLVGSLIMDNSGSVLNIRITRLQNLSGMEGDVNLNEILSFSLVKNKTSVSD